MQEKDNELTQAEKLIYVMNSLEKTSDSEERAEEFRKIKQKLIEKINNTKTSNKN